MATVPAPAPTYGMQTYDTAPTPSRAYVSKGLIRSKMRKRKKKARPK